MASAARKAAKVPGAEKKHSDPQVGSSFPAAPLKEQRRSALVALQGGAAIGKGAARSWGKLTMAMATALERELAKVRVSGPGAPAGLQPSTSSQGKPSILYEPKQAASLGVETLLDRAENGKRSSTSRAGISVRPLPPLRTPHLPPLSPSLRSTDEPFPASPRPSLRSQALSSSSL